ncbi:hypothetical protein [Andreprevotia chitinilytica]|uniref:hypothetical protein n=1 Tax=Andreprevotia chitinilytica TaxID=396808 RepID=UPI00068B29E2|nr:hypothetical protein [Andreprevotia chitinilytica]
MGTQMHPDHDDRIAARLHRALGFAQWRLGLRPAPAGAQALDALDPVDLPPDVSDPQQIASLEAAGPLYLARELESAQLLPAVELITGLFTGGTINQSLGNVGQKLLGFWRTRHQRLGPTERQTLFAHVFEEPAFTSLMQALCTQMASTMNAWQPPIWQPHGYGQIGVGLAGIGVSQAAQAVADFLAGRLAGMATYAAGELIQNIRDGVEVLKAPEVQTAFNVRGMWALVALVANQRGLDASQIHAHVERGQAGQLILTWLAQAAHTNNYTLDPHDARSQAVINAAATWLVQVPGDTQVGSAQTTVTTSTAPPPAVPAVPSMVGSIGV